MSLRHSKRKETFTGHSLGSGKAGANRNAAFQALTAIERTGLVWPVRVALSLPAAKSQRVIPSPQANSVWPSGVDATADTSSAPRWFSAARSCRLTTSTNLMVPLSSLDARVLPSLANATERAKRASPSCRNVASSLPVATFQSFTVWSPLAEAKVLPSGVNARHQAGSRCPWRDVLSFGSCAGQCWLTRQIPIPSGDRCQGDVRCRRIGDRARAVHD